MKQYARRALLILLALTLCLGMCNVTAFAEAGEKAITESTEEKTIAEQYKELYHQALELKEEDYTPESWAAFNEYWSVAPKTDDCSGLDEKYQKLWLTNLQNAMDKLVPVEKGETDPESNYAKYLQMLEEAQSLDSSLYTEESWAKFERRLNSILSSDLPEAKKEYEENGDIRDHYIEDLEVVFRLLYRTDTVEKVLTDEETGFQIISNNYDLKDGVWLDIEKTDESNWSYMEGSWMAEIPEISSEYCAYKITMRDEAGNPADILRAYQIVIPVPEEFDIDNLDVNFRQKSGAKYKLSYEIDKEKRLLTVSVEFTKADISNGIEVFLSNPITVTDTSELEDGVYQVKVNLVKHSDSSTSSMANGTLNGEAILVKEGDAVDAYLSFGSIKIFDEPSYTGGLWCEVGKKADGQIDESSMTVLVYYCNEDGTLLDNGIYDAITEVGCLKQIKLRLNEDCKNEKNGYTLAVMAPAMAQMNGLEYEEIIVDELLVNLLISNPEYLGTTETAKDSIPVYDKSALMKEIEYAGIFSEKDYTAESYEALSKAVAEAQEVYGTEYEDKWAASDAYVEQINKVKAAVAALEESTELTEARQALQEAIDEAKKVEQGNKTDSAYATLEDAIRTAESVLSNTASGVEKLQAAKTTLEEAVETFNNSSEASALDPTKLEDGEYKVYVDMKQVDKATNSMSNGAIDHWINLSVKDGEYTATLDFNGMTISGQYGYLLNLKYYDKGYTFTSTGDPKGTLVPATVVSTQKNADGSDVIDGYNDENNLYPDIVSFPLVYQGEQEWIPLQVYVPIMESITAGTGTQNVLMKIDWTSLKTADDDTQQEIEFTEDGIYTVTSEIREVGSDDVSPFNSYLDKVRLTAENGTLTAYIDFKSVMDGDTEKYIEEISIVNGSAAANRAGRVERAVLTLLQNVEYTDIRLKDNTGTEVEARLYLALRSAALQTADKTTLKEYIDKAEAILDDGKIYTEESLAALKEALEAAKEVYGDEVAINSEISSVGLTLKNAISTMEEQTAVDKTELKAVIEEASKITNEDGKYTEESYQALTEALENAKAVYENKKATESDVKSQTMLLKAAIQALVETAQADKDDLKAAIEKAESLNAQKDEYMADSWNALLAVYNAAVNVYKDAEASQSMIDTQTRMLLAAIDALILKPDGDNKLADGLYEISGEIVNAARPDQLSMADGALEYTVDEDGNKIKNPLHIVVKDGQAYVRMRFVELTSELGGQAFSGYLGELLYYPDYEDTDKLPEADEKLAEAIVEYRYEGYDKYNDPEFGSDAYMKGTKYPEQVAVPIEIEDAEVWLKVYVPVMESISVGSGTQQARLRIDWSTVKQVRDESVNIQELEKQIEIAGALEKGDASDLTWEALQKAIAAAKAVYNNLSATQEQVDTQILLLQSAIASVQSENGSKADKIQLQLLIENAQEELKKTDVYTEESLKTLQTILLYAQSVYENEDAGQEAVNAAAAALEEAIGNLVPAVDTSLLEEEIVNAEKMVTQTDKYTKDSIEMLQIAINNAKRVLADTEKTQEEVDRQVTALQNAQKGMIEKTAADKSTLKSKIEEAQKYLEDESKYTASSVAALKTAISNAQAAYNNEDATQAEVDAQVTRLDNAIAALVEAGEKLDPYSLKDGVYSIYGEMVKIDKETYSMSNEAINHTIKLTVKDEKYYLTMNFNGLRINDQYGYLGTLKYFLTGYTKDQYGAPQGKLADVTVDSYQTDENENWIKDSFGTDYPDYVTFELIPEALNDGYVPLQVFVPIMESIAAGTGTQPVYLKLDWSTLKAAEADDPAFEDNGSNDDDDDNNSGLNGGSSLTGGSSLSGGSNLSSGSGLNSSSGLKSSSGGLSSGTSGSSSLKASSVKTGDETPVGALAGLTALALGAAVLALYMKRSERNSRKAERK